jgi:uncharacterized protein YjbI with pentapeptide repeats
MANPEHVAMLKRGTADWNAWRSSVSLVTPDLREADFANAELAGANLAYAQLHDAHFERDTSTVRISTALASTGRVSSMQA